MADAAELLRTLKKAAVEAVRASKPAEICFGKVTSISPLKIYVDQKITLGKSQLVLSRNVTDYMTEVTVEWLTENKGSGSSVTALHNHMIIGRKKITVHNGLAVGDEVILFRQQGGQKYIVADKIA